MTETSKKSDNYRLFLIFIILFATLILCKPDESNSFYKKTESKICEISEIKLKGEASLSSAELSGLTWFGDELILLPQYPFGIGNNTTGNIYKITKSRIIDYINCKDTTQIEPEKISIEGKGLERFNDYGQGYESIAFNGNDVYLTIEAAENHKMAGYVIKGKINNDATEIVLNAESLAFVKPQADIHNLSDETIFIYNNCVCTLFEANGKNINPSPVAHRFDFDLKPLKSIKFPNVEYRITDATTPNADGKYWVINYMYSGDWDSLKPAHDGELDKYIQSDSSENFHKTERLLEYQITGNSVVRTETPPIQLKILKKEVGRNWEGLAKLDNYGFILVTDEHPRTILGYLEFKER